MVSDLFSHMELERWFILKNLSERFWSNSMLGPGDLFMLDMQVRQLEGVLLRSAAPMGLTVAC